MRRRSFALAGPFVALALLSGCSGLGAGRKFVISQAELQDRIARQFPLERQVLSLVDLRIAAPQVRLLPEQNRLAADVGVEVNERAFNGNYLARLAFDSGLAIDPADASLRLASVRVSAFDIERGSGLLQAQVRRVGAALAQQVLEGFVVWRPKPEQLQRLTAAGLKAGPINVTDRGIEIALVPVGSP